MWVCKAHAPKEKDSRASLVFCFPSMSFTRSVFFVLQEVAAEEDGEKAKKNGEGAQPMDAGVLKLPYLFADEGIVMNRCIARSQAKSSLEPVFKQCCRPLHSSQYCTMHWKKAMLTRGTWKMGNWDPDTNHSSLPARELLDGQRKAERRYVAAVRRGDGPGLRWERRKRRFV